MSMLFLGVFDKKSAEKNMIFEVLMVVKVQMLIFWIYTLCCSGGINQCFRG